MKIGIFGAGSIGGNLGQRWAKKGHAIRFGVQDVAKAAKVVDACGGDTAAGDVRSAADFGDVLVLAVPWAAVPSVLEAAGKIDGKILVDATNALRWSEGSLEPAITDTSGAQKIAEMCPNARVVKAFNTLGAEHILNPNVGGHPADALVCADDASARATVSQLAEEIGFTVVDMGVLKNARLTEHIALAWIYLAMKAGKGRNIAFKLLGT